MTTEANDNDPRVSDAYREIASEETPVELDRKVLAMAAAEVRAANGLPRTWFRPLAWAATIALSFAFVLEMSQVDDAPAPLADADLAEVLEESPGPVDAAAKQKDEGRMRQQLNKRSSDAPASAKASIAPAQSLPSTADEALNQPAMGSPSVASPSVASDFEIDDMSVLREAEEQARTRSEPARSFAAIAEKKEQSEGCDEDARASANTWYQCVKTLRDTGQMEPARQELDALLAEFPDFREPAEQR
jgi:hypothetical protein